MKTTMRGAGLVLALLTALAVLLLAVGMAKAGHGPLGTPLWGYQAAFSAQMAQYDIGAHAFTASCVPASGLVPPNAFGNGRGVAFDPFDGNLWYTVLNLAVFTGDGLIHKTTLPPVCVDLPAIPFGDGLGGAIQDSIGALDIDPDDGHLWAAGFQPIGGLSFLYKVDRVAGAILQSCSVPFGGGGVGNDTLAVAKLAGLPGSGKYLLTDAGEPSTPLNGETLLVVDAATCVGGGAGVIVAAPPKVVPMTGIDYEVVGGVPKFIATDLNTIFDLGGFPFGAVVDVMSASPVFNLEDITLGPASIVKEVEIDVKPFSDPNSINPKSRGTIPVAILSTPTFDATSEVDKTSLTFGRTGNEPSLAFCTNSDEDVNLDGLLDIVCHFDTLLTGFTVADTAGILKGQTVGGTPIGGRDAVRIVDDP